jgi:cysteinyl-tRNA synthetase
VPSATACHICGKEGHKSRFCPRAANPPPQPGAEDTAAIEAKKASWAEARERKDYETADRIRAELLAVGVNPNKPSKEKKASRPTTAMQRQTTRDS